MPSDDQLQELWDKQALHENLMTYVRGVDREDEELMKSAYWPDSTDDHGYFVGGGQEWGEEAVKWKDLIYSNNHHIGNVFIEIDGDRAKRESMFMNVVNFKEPAVSMFTGGRYRDLCEKRDGVWKILHRVCVWDWCEQRATTPGWDMQQTPHMSNWGDFYPNDPIYQDWTKPSPSPFPATRPR